ncbi:MAG: fibronectin type III domain-containing protein [Bacteroidales bacterium]|nr:fibronectin type III domain-containing protein [Bacteroidales bacterium]
MKKTLFSLLLICFACFGVANAQQSLPYSYGFEDNDLATDGWTAVITNANSGINSAAAHTGSVGFRFNYNEQSAYLVSPELEGGTNGVEVSFYYKSNSTSWLESFNVGYTTDASAEPSAFTYIDEITNAPASWTKYEGTFPAGTVKVAIQYVYTNAFYLNLDDFSFEAVSDCPRPKNLAVDCPGTTATISWTEMGSATEWNLDIDGTVVTTTNNPYTLSGLELNSTHTVKVQSACGSDWSDEVSFTTPPCEGGHIINYTLNDSYGDGWNGNAIQVVEGCGTIVETLTIASGSSNSGTLTLCGDYYEFIWVNGSYPQETSFTFTENGTTLFTKPSSVSDGMVLYTIGTQAMPKPTGLTTGTPEAHSVALSWTENGTATAWQICVNNDEDNLIDANSNPFTLTGLDSETDYTVKVRSINGTGESCWSAALTFTTAESSCVKPTNLAQANISFTTADLSWEGTSDSYVLQYRPWNPAGDDIITTGAMVTYTVDLSQYEGTGSVAIRHYDISDMFALIVDDIQVTNAAGTVVYSQNFESCGGNMPAEFTNMDLDGDGNTWEIGNNTNLNVNGTYGIISYSYDNAAGPLTPDNWLILSGIQMGGQMTFQARGQDPAYAAENFAIYVSTESSVVEVPVTTTTYNATGLTPNTPYAWQVKGVCEEEESSFVSSFFKTKDDMLVFATDGNWNVVANWTDADGNAVTALPTADNNVRIDAAVTIPAGVVAVANKATIGTGSITIEDGGQLKQNAASLRVTMEKEITGYGESDGNYYFIASPFNGRTLYQTSGSFSHVDNMLTGEYDLYAFDATEELEWINYKSTPDHIAFQAENGLAGLLYGEGYLYANQDGTTIEFEGTAGKSNNYSETKAYTFDSESTDDWNGWALVGNFFTCNAYINYVDANGNTLEADFYTLNNDNTYTLSQTNVALAPCTGALINYSTTGKVQFSTEAPATGKSSMLNMTVTEGRNKVDQARVRFGEGHNLKHMSFRNSSKLYMPVDGNDYAVVYAEAQGEMPVNFKAENNGTYTINFSTQEVSFSYLHLIDNLTGNDVDLLANPSYTFDANTSDYSSRFKLVFATGENSSEFAFVSNNNLIINGEGTLHVIDMTGRIIATEEINGVSSIKLNAAAGVYVLQLNDKTQKIVIK